MIDCLILGYNVSNFQDYVTMVRAMGTDYGNYRDLRFHFVEHEGKPYRSMDILNHFHFKDKVPGSYKPLHNADFMWPVVLYLGSFLSRRGLSFDYINLFQFEKEKLKEKLLNEEILTIAITTTMYVTPHPILEIISFIKKYNKSAKIIIGGPYILNSTGGSSTQAEIQRVFKFIGADFYIVNTEGETALEKIIRAVKNNGDYSEIDNIYYKSDNGFIFTKASEENNSLEENPVDYKLFSKESLGEYVSLRTSKSCPFACTYCGFHERGGKYKFLDVAHIEKDLNALRDIGSVKMLTFIDDTLNVPKDRFKELLRTMVKNKYNFKWNCFYRCDFRDEESLELMKEAGCEGVFLGVESGNERVLKNMNKGVRPKDVYEMIPRFRELGIVTHTNFIVGFPGETEESVQDTINLIQEAKPDFFNAQLWYCDPITPIYKKREEYGIKGSAFRWTHNTMDWKTACDLLEKVFMTVHNSNWLPLDGFAFWSVFYLQRRGMTLPQIKEFLRFFRLAAGDQLKNPGRNTIAPELMDDFVKSCQFGSGIE
ncbi:radical SAM PhpK family P-methyltransferase [Anaerobacterium chartisolvens]|uniref:Radical SAM PhpK family P-methyltransferase n=1 Tax=Anaerobacterium chartisolvens TaxID=1297424 RepID=A0A369BF80_9FIRM|nr:PhpK family radical SAM P-methyltransferase [Anaerobacterium chartisolvens]RCX18354.1 radical SAM PhpK family P-methyltransferase [Anaerobacterium chartisolvens]